MNKKDTFGLQNLLNEVNSILTVRKIMTHKENFVYYEDLKKDELKDCPYDVVPAKDCKKYWWKQEGKLLEITPELIISSHLPIYELIDFFNKNDFYFVTHNKGIEGIVHFSDLQKQEVRILFYTMLSFIEMQFRELYSGEERKVEKSLSKNRLDELNKQLEKDRKNNQNLALLDYLLFSDFLKVLCKDKCRLQKIKFSKKKFKKFNSLNSLRNWVAHPSKENLSMNKSIKEFLFNQKKKIIELCDLLEKIQKC